MWCGETKFMVAVLKSTAPPLWTLSCSVEHMERNSLQSDETMTNLLYYWEDLEPQCFDPLTGPDRCSVKPVRMDRVDEVLNKPGTLTASRNISFTSRSRLHMGSNHDFHCHVRRCHCGQLVTPAKVSVCLALPAQIQLCEHAQLPILTRLRALIPSGSNFGSIYLQSSRMEPTAVVSCTAPPAASMCSLTTSSSFQRTG